MKILLTILLLASAANAGAQTNVSSPTNLVATNITLVAAAPSTNLHLAFSDPDREYIVETKTNLNQTNWSAGWSSGGTVLVPVTNRTVAEFFRVRTRDKRTGEESQ